MGMCGILHEIIEENKLVTLVAEIMFVKKIPFNIVHGEGLD